LPIKVNIFAIRLANPDDLRHGLSQHTKFLLTLAQFIFSLFALGNVTLKIENPNWILSCIAQDIRIRFSIEKAAVFFNQ